MVRARITVLAGGGIGNARLLLLSRLGNDHDLVGRYFMEHLGVRSGVVVPKDPSMLTQTSLYGHEREGRIRPTLRLDEAVVRDEQLLNTTFLLESRPRAFAADGVRSFTTLHRALTHRPRPPQLLRHARAVIRDIDDVARTVRARMRRVPDEILVLRVQAEQAPNRNSRVMLGARRDGLGLQKPQLDWRLSVLDRRSIRRTQDIIARELAKTGLGSLDDRFGDEAPPALLAGLYHHLGTTRMHADPKHGVVDADGLVHRCSNLFVTGGSVFATGGWANPTLTVVALAIRLADHLKDELQRI